MIESNFQRETRYIVVKLSKLDGGYSSGKLYPNAELAKKIEKMAGNALVDCVVVETDKPEDEPVWQMIKRRVTGQPAVTAEEELDAVLHWRNKHAIAIKERDALQLRMNAADERIDELTANPSEVERQQLMEIVEQYPRGDPLELRSRSQTSAVTLSPLKSAATAT